LVPGRISSLVALVVLWAVLVGAFGASSIMLAEAGAALGAIQVGGTGNLVQLPYFVIACFAPIRIY